jgi:mono/diheme cytochrome c family protein
MRTPKSSFWIVVLFSALAVSTFAAPSESILTNLVFDADTKQYDASLTDKIAPFKFYLTNTWSNGITIDRVQTSCGCTVASLPSNPWHVPSGGHGEVTATVNLVGKGTGLLQKTITFFVSVDGAFIGTRVATVKVNIPEPPPPRNLSPAERTAAMEKAKADPQEIFKNAQCAECHVNQGRNVSTAKLYAADCGICHDSPNRATFVPDLRQLKVATSFSYWKQVVAHGKPHTLMPGFAASEGGPLSDEQVHSLAEYLNRNFSGHGSQ